MKRALALLVVMVAMGMAAHGAAEFPSCPLEGYLGGMFEVEWEDGYAPWPVPETLPERILWLLVERDIELLGLTTDGELAWAADILAQGYLIIRMELYLNDWGPDQDEPAAEAKLAIWVYENFVFPYLWR